MLALGSGAVTRSDLPLGMAPLRNASGEIGGTRSGDSMLRVAIDPFTKGFACFTALTLSGSLGQAGLVIWPASWGGGRSRVGGITSGERSRKSMRSLSTSAPMPFKMFLMIFCSTVSSSSSSSAKAAAPAAKMSVMAKRPPSAARATDFVLLFRMNIIRPRCAPSRPARRANRP